MKLGTLKLSNFRCFGPDVTTIFLDEMTGVVGTNGSGKSSVLQALVRLFGTSPKQRTLTRSDFHIPAGVDPDLIESISLFIEVVIEFPELASGNESEAVPECFNQMVVAEREGATPYCRVRLTGTWRQSGLPEGDVDQKLSWIKSSSETVSDDDLLPMQAFQRSRIQVHYVPAAKNPLKQIQQAAGSVMYRLFRCMDWSEQLKQNVSQNSSEITASFEEEPGVKLIKGSLRSNWLSLNSLPLYESVKLQPIAQELEQFLKTVEVVLGSESIGQFSKVQDISDGLKSLFYLTLIVTAFEIEETIVAKQQEGVPDTTFDVEKLDPPMFSLFAIEEPENHLAPHYLGRVIKILKKIADSARGQVLLTSHAPSIIKRLDPEQLRHFRLHATARTTIASAILLPNKSDDAFKFVKEAVRAHPELYFSQLVVLGEGDSEEVVLPHIARAHGISTDQHFVSYVPLGGRFVNHIWKLLTDLEIPHLTLLDLDREREGGGWGRIKYALEQLLANGVDRDALPRKRNGEAITAAELSRLHNLSVTRVGAMARLIKGLEKHGVFFSVPLDLDFAMLEAFLEPYKDAKIGSGPNIPEEKTEKYEEYVATAIKKTLKRDSENTETYRSTSIELFIWYKYLFLSKGKPLTHHLALQGITTESLLKDMPSFLQRLAKAIQEKLGVGQP